MVLRQTGYPLPNAQDWLRHNADKREGEENFSILDELEQCRQGQDDSSSLIFKQSWPGSPVPDSTLSNIWSQHSNPLTSGPLVEGYIPLDVKFPGFDFNGLTNGAINSFSSSLLCNDCNAFSWYFAVGCVDTGPCNDPVAFPGPCTETECYCAPTTELFVDCGGEQLRWGLYFLASVGISSLVYVAFGIIVGLRAGRHARRGSVAAQPGFLGPNNGLGSIKAHPHFGMVRACQRSRANINSASLVANICFACMDWGPQSCLRCVAVH